MKKTTSLKLPVMLDASHFKVDLAYQRDPKDRLPDLEKIAEKWDANKFGVIHVVIRADGYYIIDGAGRCYINYVLKGHTGPVPCIVWPKMPFAAEAKLFVDLNRDRKTVNSGDMFKASVAAENVEDVAIKAVFDKYGMTLGARSDSTNIASVGSARTVYRRASDALDKALATKVECWPEEVCAGGLLEGIAIFHSVPKLDEDSFHNILKSMLPGSVLAKLKDLPNGGIGRAPLKRYTGELACALWMHKYNKGRQRNRITGKMINEIAGAAREWTPAT